MTPDILKKSSFPERLKADWSWLFLMRIKETLYLEVTPGYLGHNAVPPFSLNTPQHDRAQQVVMIWSLSIIFYSVGWMETAAVYLQTKLSNNLYALCQRHGSVSIQDLVIAKISPVLLFDIILYYHIRPKWMRFYYTLSSDISQLEAFHYSPVWSRSNDMCMWRLIYYIWFNTKQYFIINQNEKMSCCNYLRRFNKSSIYLSNRSKEIQNRTRNKLASYCYDKVGY